MAPSSIRSYFVGWLCATPIDFTAAMLMLDREYSSPPDFKQHKYDDNSYHFGQIKDHNVVITSLRDRGPHNAATAAQSMVLAFSSIRFLLTVGTGAGIPSFHNDIRLGDVVVSCPGNGFGGVVPFEAVKRTQGSSLRLNGAIDRPHTLLLSAVATVRSNADVFGQQCHHIRAQATDSLSSHRTRDAFSYPGYEQDRLFKKDYRHVGHPGSCVQCSSSKQVIRRRRTQANPVVHYGLIASGSFVVEDAEVAARLADEYNILCVETEAAGSMTQCKGIVIRGISSYADSHKNTRWEYFAAINAAAYAKGLLSVIHSGAVNNRSPYA